MNISEVYMLRDNLWMFYAGLSYPSLFAQIADYEWHLNANKITERSYPYTPQQSAEVLFNWVKE